MRRVGNVRALDDLDARLPLQTICGKWAVGAYLQFRV